ncbi:hypothetical protein ACS0TY_021094 [Phlomoides rotata]
MSTKEAMDLGGSRRRGSAPKAGSVWESRMKNDEVRGGIKVFNATPEASPETTQSINGDTQQSPVGKRKTWKSETFAGLRSELSKDSDENRKELSVSSIKKTPISIGKTRSGPSNQSGDGIQLRREKSELSKNLDGDFKNSEDKKEVHESRSDEDVCEEKAITSIVGQIKNPSDGGDDEDFVKIEIENKNLDIKEITVQDHKPKKSVSVIEEKKIVHSIEKSVPSSPIVKKNNAKFNPNNFPRVQRTNSKLQSFVELVMWRDVSKSAFVFGIGTFAIISSSYTKDLNISFISVVSYLGLVYLAAIFLFRSLISRGSREMNSVVGEEEAIWVVKLFLPYVNEFLVKLRALFSGDPATTMKLAVLLFILARCGSSITIWKMAKLGFIGVFTVPKVCSTYSSQLTAYGKFWIRRFGDAWKSCTHKKAVGFAIFTVIWNFSSVVARIWAVFMLFVAFKYYQQSLIKEGWVEEMAANSENSTRQRQSVGMSASGHSRFIQTDTRKQKKVH